MNSLSLQETTLRTEVEAVIAGGRENFVKVGNALATMRDKKLYRDTHSSFANYCKDKWGWSRQRGYQMIQAVEVVEGLTATLAAQVTNEADARALSQLEPSEQKKVIRDAKREGVSIAEKASHFCEKPDSIDQKVSTGVDTLEKEPPKKVIDHRLDYEPEPTVEPPEKKLTYAELEKRYEQCRALLKLATKTNDDLNDRVAIAEEMAPHYEELLKVINSDDRLKAYSDECKILREKIRLLDVRINQLLIEVQQADAHARKHKRKLDDYEKRAATT